MTASQYTEWILSTLQEKQLNFMFKTLHSPWRKGGKCITHQWALLYTLTATKPVTLLQHSLHWFISAEEAWPHMNSSRCWGLLQRSWPVQLLYRYSYKQSWFYCGLPACSHWSQQCKRAKRYQLHSYPVSLLGHFHIMQLRTVETNAVISILLQSAPGTDQLTSTWSGRILLVPSWQPSLFLCCALQESLQINLLFVFKEFDISLNSFPRWVKWQACHFIFILILTQIRWDFYSGQLSKQAARATPCFSSSSLGHLRKKSNT